MLIAIRLEEASPGGEFPVASLAWTRTVAELARVATAWTLRREPHAPQASGFLAVGLGDGGDGDGEAVDGDERSDGPTPASRSRFAVA